MEPVRDIFVRDTSALIELLDPYLNFVELPAFRLDEGCNCFRGKERLRASRTFGERLSLLKTQIGLVLVARFQMAMIRWRNCRGRCGTQLHVECIPRERPEHDGHAIAVRGSLTSCPVGECRVLRGAAIVAVVQTTEVGNGHDRAVGRPRDGS